MAGGIGQSKGGAARRPLADGRTWRHDGRSLAGAAAGKAHARDASAGPARVQLLPPLLAGGHARSRDGADHGRPGLGARAADQDRRRRGDSREALHAAARSRRRDDRGACDCGHRERGPDTIQRADRSAHRVRPAHRAIPSPPGALPPLLHGRQDRRGDEPAQQRRHQHQPRCHRHHHPERDAGVRPRLDSRRDVVLGVAVGSRGLHRPAVCHRVRAPRRSPAVRPAEGGASPSWPT